MVDFNIALPNFYARDPRTSRTLSTPNMLYYASEAGQVPSASSQRTLLPQSEVGAAISSAVLTVSNIVPAITGTASGPLGVIAVPGVTILDSGRPVQQILGSRQQAARRGTVNPLSPINSLTSALASSVNRLINNGLPTGADYRTIPVESYQNYNSSFDPSEDNRVIVTDPTGLFIAASPITAPLEDTGGVLFPYTPQITFSHKANYESESLVHTNYEHMYYKNSSVEAIGITAQFTASNSDEARYILAVIHFFRSVTKMFYGQDSLAGTPPPILFLDGYGNLMIDHVPVLVTGFDYQLPIDVDYISIDDSRSSVGALVPTSLSITVNLKPTYSRNTISNTFGLEKFVNGNLITGGRPGEAGPGGFI